MSVYIDWNELYNNIISWNFLIRLIIAFLLMMFMFKRGMKFGYKMRKFETITGCEENENEQQII